jgi:hypothetical protein
MSWGEVALLTHATQVESLIGALVKSKSNSLMTIVRERGKDEY